MQEQEPENDNQVLAVWGSPGSGKTVTAVKLAVRLAMQKRDVALLLCDMNTPMLPCICPPGELEEEHSLGSILAASHVSESLFLVATRLLHRLENLFREDYRKASGGNPFHIDRKRRCKLSKKKQAQGHRRDDHEPIQQHTF